VLCQLITSSLLAFNPSNTFSFSVSFLFNSSILVFCFSKASISAVNEVFLLVSVSLISASIFLISASRDFVICSFAVVLLFSTLVCTFAVFSFIDLSKAFFCSALTHLTLSKICFLSFSGVSHEILVYSVKAVLTFARFHEFRAVLISAKFRNLSFRLVLSILEISLF
jgi:hypothetical protein